MSNNNQIPYKIYLEESEMPKAWYNVRADMINKPAPLLDPETLKPITLEKLSSVFCEELAKQEAFAKRRAGYTEGRWCVLDYGDVMVHVFHEQDREYYQLERLWADGTNELELSFEKEETEQA